MARTKGSKNKKQPGVQIGPRISIDSIARLKDERARTGKSYGKIITELIMAFLIIFIVAGNSLAGWSYGEFNSRLGNSGHSSKIHGIIGAGTSLGVIHFVPDEWEWSPLAKYSAGFFAALGVGMVIESADLNWCNEDVGHYALGGAAPAIIAGINYIIPDEWSPVTRQGTSFLLALGANMAIGNKSNGAAVIPLVKIEYHKYSFKRLVAYF